MARVLSGLIGSLLVSSGSGYMDIEAIKDSGGLRGGNNVRKGYIDESDEKKKTERRTQILGLLQNCCVGEMVLPGDKDIAVIASVTRGSDVSFLADQPHEAHLISDYSMDGTQSHGYESAAYSRYILDHYDELPDKMAFIHGHKSGWEIGNENEILTHLNKDSYDYMGLSGKWAVDLRDPDIEDTRRFIKEIVKDDKMLKKFPSGRFEFSFASGGAFLVSSKRVKLHDKATWQRIFDWLQANPSKQDARALEFSWHMLMGEEAEMNPPDHKVLCPQKPSACTHNIYADSSFPRERLDWYAKHNPNIESPIS